MASSFPPIQLQQSQPISASAALAHLQKYLESSSRKENAHLLPNATLSTTGPIAKGDSSGNLVLHNLRRVEAGLKGEWLAPVLDIEESVAVGSGAELGGLYTNGAVNGDAIEEGNGEGWQDLEEYQREQSIETGEVGPETTEVAQEGEEMLPLEVASEPVVVDKEARKRAKKERLLQERREKAKKAQTNGD